MPRRGSPYGPAYRRARAPLLGLPCQLRLVCGGAPADSSDHVPPISMHVHREGSGCCRLVPACLACQHHQGGQLRRLQWRAQRRRVPTPSRLW